VVQEVLVRLASKGEETKEYEVYLAGRIANLSYDEAMLLVMR